MLFSPSAALLLQSCFIALGMGFKDCLLLVTKLKGFILLQKNVLFLLRERFAAYNSIKSRNAKHPSLMAYLSIKEIKFQVHLKPITLHQKIKKPKKQRNTKTNQEITFLFVSFSIQTFGT